MFSENILSSRAIGPTGRLMREPTFLGAVLIGLAAFVVLTAVVFLGSFL
jgi:hypothetical protein